MNKRYAFFEGDFIFIQAEGFYKLRLRVGVLDITG